MSASSSKNPEQHDVFISFSGEDIRNTFLSHLLSALKKRENVNVFIDTEIRRGEEISPALINSINNSYIYIVIFSENYPKSTWCLAELAQIYDCYQKKDKKILPVFYGVDPSVVQNLEEDFDVAFVQHRQRFNHCLEKVDIWSRALKEISLIAGFVSSIIMNESMLVDDIVNSVSAKLKSLHPCDHESDGFFGIDSRVSQVESSLSIELTDHVRLVGIWGMGGIGKTTIADKVYNKINHNFDAHYFAANVREAFENHRQKDLRDELYGELLGEKNLKIGTPQSLEPAVLRRLRCKKVLIVLDDVNDSMQLRSLLGKSDFFCPGSRIIVTTRDSQVLNIVHIEVHIYTVEGLNDGEALKLFSWCAFHQNHPQEEYMNLSKGALKYAQGIPLTLIVLGSDLINRSIDEWEAQLKKVQDYPDKGIQKILRISYDRLDTDEQRIFLDIACFFKWRDEIVLKRILKCYGFNAEIGIQRLFEKSLVTRKSSKLYPSGYCITMHDLVEQMGREIVVEESKKIEKRSRLWKYEEIIDVLGKDSRTAEVEGISLNMLEINEKAEISCTALEKMQNLRFLRIYTLPSTLHFPNGLLSLPNTLKYLYWQFYPFQYLPSNCCLDKLVELHVPHSKLKKLGALKESFKSLEHIDASFSYDLISVDFSNAGKLCYLNLDGCSLLEEISWSVKAESQPTKLDLTRFKSLRHLLKIPHNIKELHIFNFLLEQIEELHLDGDKIRQLSAKFQSLKGLQSLDLRECSSLASLPDIICELKSLEDLDVSNCVKLRQLPEKLGNLQILKKLEATNSGIERLPDSIQDLKCLEALDVSYCSKLHRLPKNFGDLASLRKLKAFHSGIKELPDSICDLKSLEVLDMSYCMELCQLPKNFGDLASLRELKASCSGIKELPDSICDLKSLEVLNMSYCMELCQLPRNFGNLPTLRELNVNRSGIQELSDSICNLKSLEDLDVSNCVNLHRLPYEFGNLQNLRKFKVANSGIKELPDSICDLKFLEELDVSNCVNLLQLPDSFGNLQKLGKLGAANSGIKELPDCDLDVSNCVTLRQLSTEKFGNLQNLRSLNASKSGIQELPDSIRQLHKLEVLNCSDCKGLKLPPLNDFPSLRRIYLNGCHLSEFPEGLCSITKLTEINLSGNNFTSIPDSINKLPQLQNLYLTDCKSLKDLPELPSALEILEASNCTCLESVSTAVLPSRVLELGNCINLKQEVSKTIVDHVLDSNHLSIGKKNKWEFLFGQNEGKLWIAGSEMPERMMYKNESGSSLSITLNRKERKHRLIGCSLCAVLSSNAHGSYVKCSAILKDLSGHSRQKHYSSGYNNQDLQSDNLFLWQEIAPHDDEAKFDHGSKPRFCLMEATFSFCDNEDKPVLKCGVHPIFEEDEG